MSRTTVDLDEDLLRDLKQRAAREGTTLGRVLNGIVRLALRRSPPKPKYRFHLTTVKGGFLPGVNIEDRDALFDLMDGIR